MTATFTAITSKLGVHVDTTTHATQRAAEMAARRAIKAGAADSAAVYVKDASAYGSTAISYLGSGR
jgi:nucleotide-binding universal stress UspA family protein